LSSIPVSNPDIAAAALEFEDRPPAEALAHAVARFGPRIGFATGFGAEGCVLLDLIARHRLPVEVFTLDTGLLFPETHALWRALEARYGIRIQGVRSELTLEAQERRHGPRLWESDPDRCCALRKVEPLRATLGGFDAWVTAIRREQTPDRADARVFEADPRFGLVKVNPLAGWTHEAVWSYVREHSVPVNPLHARGYPSIGCAPCTGPVAAGEPARAGRWRQRAKIECGLHTRPAPSPEPPAPGGSRVEARAASPADAAPALFPLFLKLRGRRVLLVGAGPVAAAKLPPLLAAGADVTVIAPEIHESIASAPVRIERRGFVPGDVDGAWLVVAAALPEVNRRVREAGEARRCFVNAVDDPESASAYTGGVLRRGDATIAISTAGRAPALAGLLREGLEAALPDELEAWVETAHRESRRSRREGVPMRERRPRLLRALNRLYASRAAAPLQETKP